MRYVRAEFEEPCTCADCPCVYFGSADDWYCNLEEEWTKINNHFKRPSWCKLKVIED